MIAHATTVMVLPIFLRFTVPYIVSMATSFDRYMHDFQDNDDDGDEGNGLLWSVNSNCTYYDIDDVNSLSDSNNCYQHTALHLNIHSLPSKHEQLRAMISDLLDSGIVINYILLCQTFLTDTNCAMFQLPGYHFVCNNRKSGRGGGVGIYVKDDLLFKIRKDLTVNYGQELESIFVEIDHNSHVFIVGEIYRVPNTNELESIQRSETLLSQLSNFNGNVIVGTRISICSILSIMVTHSSY